MKGNQEAKTPSEYVAGLPEPRRTEIARLHRLIRKTVPALKPVMAYGMIGYGKYHYRYASGREGDWVTVALASHKNYISLYVCSVDESGKEYLAEKYKKDLGKVSVGKSCIRFKRIEDIDLEALKRVLNDAQRIGGQGSSRCES